MDINFCGVQIFVDFMVSCICKITKLHCVKVIRLCHKIQTHNIVLASLSMKLKPSKS